MNRRLFSVRTTRLSTRRAPGFTLVEILVATALTLLLMGAVVTMFGSIGTSVNDTRSTLEMVDRLRCCAAILQKDLAGVTATMLPPQRPECGPGYFEIIEGPVGVVISPQAIAVNYDDSGNPTADTTVGDFDDILIFTTRSTTRPFVGRCQLTADGTLQSDVAEVAWFLRGRTLYRRVLLVAPGLNLSGASAAGFYINNDISVRMVGNVLVANSLGDLTKRECRFGHDSRAFPYDARGWGQLGLPTLCECSTAGWLAGGTAPIWKYSNQIDFWSNPNASNPSGPNPQGCDPETGALALGSRVADDVILTNVIGFDVKVLDPGAAPGGAYVDLGYGGANYDPSVPLVTGQPRFHHLGDPRSGLVGSAQAARVYDTWATHYEAYAGRGSNGFDDGGAAGVVDDAFEQVTAPPYPAPLRGIQVRIRCYEPDSRQIREITVVQDFLPK